MTDEPLDVTAIVQTSAPKIQGERDIWQPLNRHPRWPLYKKLRRHVRRQLGFPALPIEDRDIDIHLAKHIDDLLENVRELFTADIVKRGQPGNFKPPSKPPRMGGAALRSEKDDHG